VVSALGPGTGGPIGTGETPEEVRARNLATKGSVNQSYEFWWEFRPEVVDLHTARTRHFYVGGRHAVQALTCMHHYVQVGFEEGIEYEMRLARSRGASRTDVLDTLSVAFLHSGHPGIYRLARTVPFLRDFEAEDSQTPPFPANWSFDPDILRSGMDFSTPEASHADIEAVLNWYESTVKEVPVHVRFLAERRPDLLKAYRHRWELAIRESLPVQMLPYLLLVHHLWKGSADGVRENILLGRALGLNRTQLLDAACSSVLHAGGEALDLFARVAVDMIDSFPAD
jgi:hypothetical protein